MVYIQGYLLAGVAWLVFWCSLNTGYIQSAYNYSIGLCDANMLPRDKGHRSIVLIYALIGLGLIVAWPIHMALFIIARVRNDEES